MSSLHQKGLQLCAAVLALMAMHSCSRPPVKMDHGSLTPRELGSIVSRLSEQEERARSAYALGKISFDVNGDTSEAQIAMFGTRDPVRIKIELNHFWGSPVSHILILDTRIAVLSVSEKRVYRGQLGALSSSKFLPAGIDQQQLWSLVRGYPVVLPHSRIAAGDGNEIKLLDNRGETIEIIHLYPGTRLPRNIVFPQRGLRLTYGGYETSGQIQFAEHVDVQDAKSKVYFSVHIDRMDFNRPLPGGVFRLDIPAGFKVVPF